MFLNFSKIFVILQLFFFITCSSPQKVKTDTSSTSQSKPEIDPKYVRPVFNKKEPPLFSPLGLWANDGSQPRENGYYQETTEIFPPDTNGRYPFRGTLLKLNLAKTEQVEAINEGYAEVSGMEIIINFEKQKVRRRTASSEDALYQAPYSEWRDFQLNRAEKSTFNMLKNRLDLEIYFEKGIATYWQVDSNDPNKVNQVGTSFTMPAGILRYARVGKSESSDGGRANAKPAKLPIFSGVVFDVRPASKEIIITSQYLKDVRIGSVVDIINMEQKKELGKARIIQINFSNAKAILISGDFSKIMRSDGVVIYK
ncbi:MAG: hypothetical protein L6Q54_07755 [Leptospiraceae bacterium]|nr:hypothetical protein [Leptospiraceae bacterium]MCK6381128.1 hypothetical protein [Leptospiraceae bacterium]NUM43005.1 hypothetical protein [Leptospiraceae bacterium]